jgi:branched-chain amino acid transport system permease protein
MPNDRSDTLVVAEPAVTGLMGWRPEWRVILPALAGLVLLFGILPVIGNDYWFNAILIPFLVLALAGLGLNVLTGYAGQPSLGSGALMSIGAFASYNFCCACRCSRCRWR